MAKFEQSPMELSLWSRVERDCWTGLEEVDSSEVKATSDMLAFQKRLDQWLQSPVVLLRPSLAQLRLVPSSMERFRAYVRRTSNNKADVGTLLGCVMVALEVSRETVAHCKPLNPKDDVLIRHAKQVEAISHKLDRVCALVVPTDPHSLRMALELYSHLISLFTKVIECLRQNNVSSLADPAWLEVEQVFSHVSTTLGDAFATLVALGPNKSDHVLPMRLGTLGSPTTLVRNAAEPARVMLPPRNINFFGRKSILDDIERRLHRERHETEPTVLTLSGLAGVGKSQIAREYANDRMHMYTAILWISSETTITVDQSFRHAASCLDLKNVSEKEGLQNRIAVVDALEKLDGEWLVIFDNLDDRAATTSAWPRGRKGSIIITCVNSNITFGLACHFISVPVFFEDDGAKFLLNQAGISADDSTSLAPARKLSEKLGGLPLGITSIAAFIRSCRLDIKNCADEFKDTIKEARKKTARYDDYAKDLSTVWTTCFNHLSKQSHSMILLGILSFLAADSVPEVLFRPSGWPERQTPPDLDFCSNMIRFSAVQGELFNWALIEKDTGGDISVHRLVQGEVQYFLSNEERQKSFDHCTFLLYHAFPKQDKGQYLHHAWTQGNPFVQHILHLNQRYLDESFSQLQPSVDYIRLLSNCAWFLFEKGNDVEAEQILAGGLDACKRLKSANDVVVDTIYAHMLNTRGILDGNKGAFDSAIDKLNETLTIRRRVLTTDDEEISGILNNLSLAYESAMKYDEALKYRRRSLEICLRHPPSPSRETKIKKRDLMLSRIHVAKREFKEANDLFPTLLEYFSSIGSWFLVAQLQIVWGNYFFALKETENSKAKYLEAARQYEEIGQVKYHPDAIACIYKVGRVLLEEGAIASAIDRFREAISRLSLSDGKSPQMARLYFMLSVSLKALGSDADLDEVHKLEDLSREILYQLRPCERATRESLSEQKLDSLVRGVLR